MHIFEKRLISVAYYLYANDALGYSEAVNLMIYHFGYHPDMAEENVRKLFRECERKFNRGEKATEYPNVWNDYYIFH